MEGKLLAAKELEKRRFMKNGTLDKKIDNEMKIMQDLRHPNIVEFVEYHDQGDYLYIIMEYVRHGDLQLYLNKNGPMGELQAKSMARQILGALSYLHRKKIVHRDIKPDNILISDTEPFTVKISDFGLSKAVKHDETFLKTFCGTLLYCAPEVFPDFDGAPAKGTKRRRGAKQQFHSYGHAADIWSFAAVLWFALCGKPPFIGISDATGEAMKNNIMSTRLDPTPLRQARVSESGVDLLCKMLQTNPINRPTERQCLLHPWLKDDTALPEDPVLQSIIEEDEYDEAGDHFSQLSLGAEAEIPESDHELEDDILEDEEFELLVNNRQSKKIRSDPIFPRNQLRDRDHASSAIHSFHSRVDNSIDEDESFKIIQKPAGRPRLFGEIGQSGVQSSSILKDHANHALSHEASSGEGLPAIAHPATQTRGKEPLQESSTLGAIPNLDGILSSPSLLGAESMVRELNMASPHSPISNAQSPIEPTTPRTPEMHQHGSLDHASQHPSQFSDATPKAKPPTLNRQISLPKTASFYYDPYDPNTHNLEYASKASGFDFVGAAQAAKAGASELDDTMRVSAQDEHSSEGEESAKSGPVLTLPPEMDIRPPPRRLGKLTATPNSFAPGLTLMIDQSRTSWGRLPENTLVYENGRDTRVPKIAFIIFWWSSSGDTQASVKELSQQGKDWTTLDNLHVGIFTCATSGISVNGKHLRQKDEKGRALYGFLHSGDVIQVYHDSRGTECLKFTCEFYHGSGKEPRPSGEGFNIFQGSKLLSE
jgi:serine/threonine protein kinase